MADAAQGKQAGWRGREATAAWRHRDFRLYSAARFLGTTGAEAQAVGVAWQVYQLTHSALSLGATGLALFLPALLFTLPAGHLADRHDRRMILQGCYVLQLTASALLLMTALRGVHNVWIIYSILFVIGTGRCFAGPAAQAMVPNIVSQEHFVNAVAWGASTFQVAAALGPMIGGFLFTLGIAGEHSGWPRILHGAPLVYCYTLFSFAIYFVLVSSMRHQPPVAQKEAFSVNTMLAGLRYVIHARLLLGSISLDLFAVLLGGAVSLLPIFVQDILHEGPHGLGLLRAMPSVGALLVSLGLVAFPIKRNAGRTMLVCVGIFGAATVVFGLSRSLWLSCAALFVTGAADMVSVVVRSSILQLATPDKMRGRVSSINWLFIGTSNELGEYESGLTAHWFGAVRAVVLGGVASLAVTGLWSVFFPALRRADRLVATDLIALEEELSAEEPERV